MAGKQKYLVNLCFFYEPADQLLFQQFISYLANDILQIEKLYLVVTMTEKQVAGSLSGGDANKGNERDFKVGRKHYQDYPNHDTPC